MSNEANCILQNNASAIDSAYCWVPEKTTGSGKNVAFQCILALGGTMGGSGNSTGAYYSGGKLQACVQEAGLLISRGRPSEGSMSLVAVVRIARSVYR